MSENSKHKDPFRLTADPAAYLARPATERALELLLRCVREDKRPAALAGPLGLGKTLLLQLLTERIGDDLRCVYLPYAALPLEELCAWALGQTGAPETDDPIGLLRAHARHLWEQGSGLLLLIDDANSMPVPTARWVGEVAASSGGAVRLVIAVTDDAAGSRAIAAIGSGIEVVRLTQPMTEAETHHYVDVRLTQAGVPSAICSRFDRETVSRLHNISGGNPRRLHLAAAAVLRGTLPEEDHRHLAETKTLDGVVIPGETEEPLAPASAQESESGLESEVASGPASAPPPLAALEQPRRRRVLPIPKTPTVIATAVLVGAIVATIPIIRTGLSGGEGQTAEAPANRFALPLDAAVEAATLGREGEAPSVAEGDGSAEERGAEQAAASAALAPGEATGAFRPRELAAGGFAGEGVRAESSLEAGPVPAARSAAATGGERVPAQPEERGVEEPSGPAGATEPISMGLVTVHVNANPWASIEIDGVDFGETPLGGIHVLPGRHTVRARMPDGRTITREIDFHETNRFVVFE